MTDADFVQQLAARPYDDELRSKYIAWLDQQGDSRAEYLRLVTHEQALRRELAGIEAAKARIEAEIDEGWLTELYPLEIRSPIVGWFYPAESPELPPYVKEGHLVFETSIVCVIEALKVFNEIRAEVRGIVEKVLVTPGQQVEFGQPLFKLRRIRGISGG